MAIQQSSLNDIFRFIKVRTPKVASKTVKLLKTKCAITIQNANSAEERRAIANEALADSQGRIVRSVDDLAFGRAINAALQNALEIEDATLCNIFDFLDNANATIRQPSFNEDLEALSNTILLSLFATTNIPRQLPLFRQLYIIYYHLRLVVDDFYLLNLPLSLLLKYFIRLPFDLPDNGEMEGAKITSVGVADLLVVKQHIKRYEATEIAHIENIMSGETRRREHRNLERIEETLILEKETIVEKEQELETSERFELNKETSKTIKEDQKYGFDLSVSANYGPMVEVSTGFELDVSVSTETSAKAASKYAKDVMERSLERIKERVREERIRRIIRETEEKNLHSFENGDDKPHKVGIYQFLDKVYEAQVFNYGKRQMFDLMIPEPASYLWYLNGRKDSNPQETLPEAPEPFELSAVDILYLDTQKSEPEYYAKLAQKYGATGLTPPPEQRIVTTAKFQNPAAGEKPGA